jgi:hypothetical protein
MILRSPSFMDLCASSSTEQCQSACKIFPDVRDIDARPRLAHHQPTDLDLCIALRALHVRMVRTRERGGPRICVQVHMEALVTGVGSRCVWRSHGRASRPREVLSRQRCGTRWSISDAGAGGVGRGGCTEGMGGRGVELDEIWDI